MSNRKPEMYKPPVAMLGGSDNLKEIANSNRCIMDRINSVAKTQADILDSVIKLNGKIDAMRASGKNLSPSTSFSPGPLRKIDHPKVTIERIEKQLSDKSTQTVQP